ncbi:MAG: hypothetical protein H0V01_03125 [Bacteroidetes bacterium]|nr:hypothetical protein [Bacteroidota bacterium]HET6244909.1 hypothetical protein [Bacteroidia bacterium]
MNLLFYICLLYFTLLFGKCNEVIEVAYTKVNSGPRFEKAKEMGALENPEINEASGMVVSRSNPDLIWVHNDSGDKSRLFLIDFYGRHKGVFNIKKTENRDWEDIAIGPGPEKGVNYIYVADIGDNNDLIEIKQIYRFPEPDLNMHNYFPIKSNVRDAQIISFRFPDGNKDAETIFVDPNSADIFIVSKKEAAVNVYLASYPQSLSEVITLEHVTTIDIQQAVAGDISVDGNEILIKTYTDIYYWQRKEKETIQKALKRTPRRLPYFVEPQGEAIAWKVDASGYFTLSEKVGDEIPKLYFYERIKK